MNKKLHIVSFDVPYPANYGGVIDVFYKLKALSEQGIEVYLHVFEYGKGKQKKLEEYCKEVYYYSRNNYLKSLFSFEPFIVRSRGNNLLIANLKKVDAPILFDGLHTTFILKQESFIGRKKILRSHNVEHKFYKGLAKGEPNMLKKLFYFLESKKLEKYEVIVKNMDVVFAISPFEKDYFSKKYSTNCIYLPAFQKAAKKHHTTNKGNSILYHGKLDVSENFKAALFLINVYKNTDFKFVIASDYQSSRLNSEISKYNNITFVALKDDNHLDTLFEEAHINVLITFQKTGIKLKLLNALFRGKFVIVNNLMVEETGLEALCEIANTKEAILKKTKMLFQKKFTENTFEERRRVLDYFSSKKNAKKIIDSIY